MFSLPLILVIVGVAIALYVISIFNSLQTLKTRIVASIQEIGNQLKRQASLIPNLQASVKGYMKQEKDIFEMLTNARKSVQTASSSSSMKNIDKAVSDLQGVMGRLNILVESNPEIKSDATVAQFMNELRDTADKLMYARRTVIDLSQTYNQKLMVFPSNIIAGMFGFKPEAGLATPMTGEHVEVSSDEMKDPKVDL
ncbi:MAG: LemA family protein [Patescibacteria group bacterium]